ncbi:uncharacterized protein ACHE_20148A [Aspergillus chevalieri]|uniref:Uncharacterized protein n=1 Tax=Aspergillus chevalieri TaxID=182096 RepID=A0A7R7VH95_ASPCH|nr:uncharacterized protein ACHE_20148A [Aspergillus chevalieri]BCR84690.1 hypothetical protein ACHE_20148A [Aspergillus chevalieri]
MAASEKFDEKGRLEAVEDLTRALDFETTSTEAWLARWLANINWSESSPRRLVVTESKNSLLQTAQ